ncbi:MAG: hypothetical protein LBI84_07465 [Propionibacteriaceae bacterium]|nr:hypothetical protein [Propionibacteriaceae bacterium]
MSAGQVGSDPATLCRGINLASEMMIHDEAGLPMSGAARVGYAEGGDSVTTDADTAKIFAGPVGWVFTA